MVSILITSRVHVKISFSVSFMQVFQLVFHNTHLIGHIQFFWGLRAFQTAIPPLQFCTPVTTTMSTSD